MGNVRHDRREEDPWRLTVTSALAKLELKHEDEVKKNDQRHLENQKRLSTMEEKLTESETEKLQDRKVLTQIVIDTSTLVAMQKGATSVKKFLIWFSPVLCMLFAGLSWWGKKG